MLFFVVGIKSFVHKHNKGEGVMGRCSECSQDSLFLPATRWTFLSLFWVPLIPVWFRRILRCPNCGALFKRS